MSSYWGSQRSIRYRPDLQYEGRREGGRHCLPVGKTEAEDSPANAFPEMPWAGKPQERGAWRRLVSQTPGRHGGRWGLGTEARPRPGTGGRVRRVTLPRGTSREKQGTQGGATALRGGAIPQAPHQEGFRLRPPGEHWRYHNAGDSAEVTSRGTRGRHTSLAMTRPEHGEERTEPGNVREEGRPW